MGGTEANLTTWVFVLFERIADWSLHAGKHRILEELTLQQRSTATLFIACDIDPMPSSP